MSQQKTEMEARTEFLEEVRYKIMLEDASKDWEIKTEQKNAYLTLIVESSKRFSQNGIEVIVNIIADNELFKFDILRNFGWCSSYSITKSSPGYLEFSWMNLRSIRKPF